MSERVQRTQWHVGPEDAGARLGEFVRRALGTDASARAVKRAVERGAAAVNGRTETFASRRLAAGDRVTFAGASLGFESGAGARLVYDAGRILYEDATLLAYDKPPGYPSAPTEGGGVCVYDVVRHHRRNARGEKLFMVHRLDRDTSGVVLFIKDKSLGPEFRRLFAEGGVRKTYRAIALGEVAWKSKTLDAPLAPAGGRGPERWGVVERGGKRALTRFERLAVLRGATDLRAYPETGRTHQIRVHLAALGHPILGDMVYGRERRAPLAVARHMLHALAVKFAHPATGDEIRIEAPLPEDYGAALAALA